MPPVRRLAEDARNADWPKATWDVDLPRTTESVLAWLDEMGWTLDAFKASPLYQANVGQLAFLRDL
jgi:hypothetical protein